VTRHRFGFHSGLPGEAAAGVAQAAAEKGERRQVAALQNLGEIAAKHASTL
jgi:hypothetical protein